MNTTEERFWSKVDKTGPFWNGTPCWVWQGKTAGRGYGHFWAPGRWVYAHRYNYEMYNGTIAPGLEIDHLCRNHPCVNPDHLEAVTRQVNQLRGQGFPATQARITHCPKGHPYDLLNTRYQIYRNGTKKRECKTCAKFHRHQEVAHV